MTVEELTALVSQCLEPIHSGKVRDTYRVFGPNGELWRLIIVTDRRSIFDFKLDFTVPGVGEILNATNIFFRRKMNEVNIAHDMIACGSGLDVFLPEELRNLPDLQKRGMLVKELQMYPVECVARNYLTGSGWDIYSNPKSQRLLCGHLLPQGLSNGSALDKMLFTPTTKATIGHDLPLDVGVVRHDYPTLGDDTLKLFNFVDEFVKKTNRFMWVDGKAEGGIDPDTGMFVWGDELGSFDSCRVWVTNEYRRVWPEKVPSSYDKEILRNWGREMGIKELDPTSDEDKKLVLSMKAPEEVIKTSRMRALEFFYSLTNLSCADFQRVKMLIR
jgi:phosphoribosylaminoimidazole-succinocarboxamide synthase